MGKDVTAVVSTDAKRKDVKKHVATIHCSNTLSLLQRKISNVLLFHAYHRLLENDIHEISVKEICDLIGYKGNNHQKIKEAIARLVSTRMEWNLIDDNLNEEDWTISTILASVRIKGPQCYYAYSPHMKALLHMPQMYGTLNLITQAKFHSSYGLALYENCVRYRNLKYTKWFDLVLFRKLMGIPEDKYQIFRDLKKRVLDKAVSEINECSDLTVEAEIRKAGRAVKAIRFSILSKPKNVESSSHEEVLMEGEGGGNSTVMSNDETEVFSLLVNDFFFSRTKAQRLLAEFSAGFVKDKIEMIKTSQSYKEKKITNLAAYLNAAIRDDYLVTLSSSSECNQKDKVKEETINKVLQQSYIKHINQEIMRKFSDYSEQDKSELLGKFSKYIERTSYSPLYKREGLNNLLMVDRFCAYCRITDHELLNTLMSIEEYQKHNEVTDATC